MEKIVNPAYEVRTTMNDDVLTMVLRLEHYIRTLLSSTSANVSEFHSADLKRVKSWIQEITAIHAWASHKPEADAADVHPHELDIPELIQIDVNKISSISVYKICQIFRKAQGLLLNSETSRKANGFIVYDSERFLEQMLRVTSFCNEIVGVLDPVDLPGASPRAPIHYMPVTGVRVDPNKGQA